MTSGQGGGEPDSHGRTSEGSGAPQQTGWGQPPSAPPYGPPPGQGQGYAPAPPPPPPPGYGAPGGYGGYGPAPSAPPGWGAAAPPPMERPVTVRAGLGLFIAEIVLGLIGSIYVFSNSQGLIDRMRSQVGSNAEVSDAAFRAGLIVGAVIGLILVAVELLFIWFAWRGRNWARVVLWVVGGLAIVSGVGGLATNSQFGGFYRTLSLFQLVIVVVAVVLLALKPSHEWFRYRKWQQMTGQG